MYGLHDDGHFEEILAAIPWIIFVISRSLSSKLCSSFAFSSRSAIFSSCPEIFVLCSSHYINIMDFSLPLFGTRRAICLDLLALSF